MGQTWQNLIIQLGISALVLFVAYNIGLKVIASWRESEKERNSATREAEKERNSAIVEGFRADTLAHTQLVGVMQKMMMWCQRIESKIDTAFDLTPAPHDITTIPPVSTTSVFVEMSEVDEGDTPVDRPHRPEKVHTPTKGVPVLGGQYTQRRPKTQG